MGSQRAGGGSCVQQPPLVENYKCEVRRILAVCTYDDVRRTTLQSAIKAACYSARSQAFVSSSLAHAADQPEDCLRRCAQVGSRCAVGSMAPPPPTKSSPRDHQRLITQCDRAHSPRHNAERRPPTRSMPPRMSGLTGALGAVLVCSMLLVARCDAQDATSAPVSQVAYESRAAITQPHWAVPVPLAVPHAARIE